MEVFTLNKEGYNQLIDAYIKMSPKEVEGVGNATTLYYVQLLMHLVKSLIEFKNVPEDLDIEELKRCLFFAPIAIIKTNQGNYSLKANAGSDLDVYYKPKNYVISNPVLLQKEYSIGIDCEVLHIGQYRQFFESTIPIILHYAQQLANCDGSLDVSLINSRMAVVFKAHNDAEATSAKMIYDQITSGKPAIFTVKSINDDGDWIVPLNVKNTYIGNDLLLTKQTIMNEFLTTIGINNANTDKRERLNTDEVNANNVQIQCHLMEWLDNIKACLVKINRLFGYNIECNLKPFLRKEVTDDANDTGEPIDIME